VERYLNKITWGDCLDILPDLPDNCIDLVVTSPPYDDLRTYNDSLAWDFDIFTKIALGLERVLKDGGVIVWVVNDATVDGSETGTSFKQALYFKEIGLRLHDTMIYLKNGPNMPDINRYPNIFEYMFVLTHGKPKTFNPIKDRKNIYSGTKVHGTVRNKDGSPGKCNSEKILDEYGTRFNVWQMSNCGENQHTGHPATFPPQLAYDHIESWSSCDDVVLDCFSGSGTVAMAAHSLGRKYICIEKDADYHAASVERLEIHQRQHKLF